MSAAAFFEGYQADLVAWARTVHEIRVMLVVGSQARQVRRADDYSDLDLCLYVSMDRSQIDDEVYLEWVRRYASVWMTVDDHHAETRSWLIVYRGGYKVDLSVTPVAALQPLVDDRRLWDDQQRGYKILLDKDRLAARLPPPQPLGGICILFHNHAVGETGRVLNSSSESSYGRGFRKLAPRVSDQSANANHPPPATDQPIHSTSPV